MSQISSAAYAAEDYKSAEFDKKSKNSDKNSSAKSSNHSNSSYHDIASQRMPLQPVIEEQESLILGNEDSRGADQDSRANSKERTKSLLSTAAFDAGKE